MAGISISLAGNFQKLDELKDKSKKTAESIKASFKDGFGAKAFVGLSAAAAASLAGVVASVKSALDAAGELQDMMAKTGASGKDLLILQQAFKNAGLAASDVGGAILKMQKALAGVNEDGEPTNKVFEKLGLSINNLLAQDPAQALRQIGETLASIQDPAQRAAVAMGIFGKAGGNLNAVFTDAGAYSQAETQLGGLADLLPEIAADADAVSDAFGSLDLKSKQVGAGVAAELMPHLLEFAQWINTADFVQLGKDIGEVTEDFLHLAGALGAVAQKIPTVMAFNKVLKFAGRMMPMEGKALPMIPGISIGADGKVIVEQPPEKQSSNQSEKPNWFEEDRAKSAKDRESKAADEAQRKAKAEGVAADEKFRQRPATVEEYRLEMAITAAKEKGDNDRLAKLEREKKIREEMKRLVSGGYSIAESRPAAIAKVDAEKRAEDLDTERKDQAEAKKREIESLQDRLKDVNGKKDSLHFESTVGKVSSMQRIGGGGGAVGSGLDYARKSSDLQRETNQILREIREHTRRDTDIE